MIHVLGSDIPHHNATVLEFFNALPGPRRTFWVVTSVPSTLGTQPALDLTTYPDRRSIAQAIIGRARENRAQRFFLHGQFNPRLWLALLLRLIRPEQVHWHIWGADLYEEATGLRHRLSYPIRRLAQARVGQVYATIGDAAHFRAQTPRVPTSLLYFPTRTPSTTIQRCAASSARPFTVLVGNSGDRANRHIDALHAIRDRFGSEVRVVIPFGYPAGNNLYAAEVRNTAERLFGPSRVRFLGEVIGFDEYLAVLAGCDLGYFLFERQQGIGTILPLIRTGIPVVLSRHNPFRLDLGEQNIPLLLHPDRIDAAAVAGARAQLRRLDYSTLAFAPGRCAARWRAVLADLEQHATR